MPLPTFARWMCILGLLCFGFITLHDFSQDTDLRRYTSISSQILEPTDQPLDSEYPPLASSLFTLVYGLSHQVQFPLYWMLTIVAAIAATSWYAARYYGNNSALFFSGSTLATAIFLGPRLFFARFDILVLLLLFLVWQSLANKQYRQTGFWLVAAISLKITPIVLLPLVFTTIAKKQWRHLLKGMIMGLLTVVVVVLTVMGPRLARENMTKVLSYHSDRGVQIESTWSSAHLFWERAKGRIVPTTFRSGSVENTALGQSTAQLATIVVLVGLACIYSWSLYCKSAGLLLVTMLWITIASPVLSPQYLVWTLPLMSVWALSNSSRWLGRSLLVLTLLTAMSTQIIIPTHYGALIGQDWWIVKLLFARNGMLVLITGLLSYYLATSCTQRPQPRLR